MFGVGFHAFVLGVCGYETTLREWLLEAIELSTILGTCVGHAPGNAPVAIKSSFFLFFKQFGIEQNLRFAGRFFLL